MKHLNQYIRESILNDEDKIINTDCYSIKLKSLFNKIMDLNKEDPWDNKGLNTYQKESKLFIEIKKILRANSSIYNLKIPKEGYLYFTTYFGKGYEDKSINFWCKPNCLQTSYGLTRCLNIDYRSWITPINTVQFKNFIEESTYPYPSKSAEYEVRVLDKDIANTLIKLLKNRI